jgi:NADH-quinone oxidoreductase subunit M
MSQVLSLLIVIPFVGSALAYLVARSNKKAGIYFALAVALVVLALALYSSWFVYANTPPPGGYTLMEKYAWVGTSYFGFDYLFGVDGLSSPLIFVSALLTIFVIIGSRTLIDRHEPSYYALLLFFEGSIMGVFTSLNLVAFYVFWELVLIPMFFFIGVWGGDRRKYAAMKFMIFTFVASTVMLLAFLAVYLGVSPPSFDIPDLAGKIPAGLQYLPLIATFVGFGVKLPVFPFHTWLPDAHVQAPSPISVLLAGVLLKMGGYGFIRISIGLFPHASYQYAWVFMLVGVVTMFYGAIVAVLAKDLKRMIALTSINHMGFVIFGAFATVASGNPLGVEGAIFQMFTHALAVGCLFMLSGYVHHQAGTREISLLKGLRTTMPRTASLLVLASGAAMALPPFASFLSELMVIAAGITAYSLTAVTILVPVITAAYFLWMIKRTVLSQAETGASPVDMHRTDAIVLALYLLPLIILIVFSFLIINPSVPVAQWVTQLRGA